MLTVGWSKGAHKHEPGNTILSASRNVMNGFRTSHRVTNEGHVPKVEALDDGRKIRGQGGEVIAAARIVRPSVTAPVVGDAANALIAELRQLYSQMPPLSPHGWQKRTGAPSPQSR
jgi:hypothetical protein